MHDHDGEPECAGFIIRWFRESFIFFDDSCVSRMYIRTFFVRVEQKTTKVSGTGIY